LRGRRLSDAFRFLAIALILVEGGIHLQQYEGILHTVPTINTLFVLNAVSAAVIALGLAADRDWVGIATALGAIGLTLGSLASLAIARTSTLFDYSEPTLRGPVELAAYVEVAAILAIAGFVITRLGEESSTASRGTEALAAT